MAYGRMDAVRTIVMGRQAVGKSKLVQRLVENSYSDDYRQTIGVDYHSLHFNGVKLQLWDLAGCERFAAISKSYYSRGGLVLYCVDLSQSLNQEAIEADLAEFRQTNAEAAVIIVGTKFEEDTALANSDTALKNLKLKDPHIEGVAVVSAKQDDINELMQCITQWIQHNPSDNTPDSWAQALEDLRANLSSLSSTKQEIVINHLNLLYKTIKSSTEDDSQKVDIITQTTMSLYKKLNQIEHPVLKAFAVLAAVAVVTIIAGMIGIGIGFLAGLWSGPGAFFTALAGGAAAATSVAVASGVLGLGAGAGLAYHFFAKPHNEVAQFHIDNVVDDFIKPEPQSL